MGYLGSLGSQLGLGVPFGADDLCVKKEALMFDVIVKGNVVFTGTWAEAQAKAQERRAERASIKRCAKNVGSAAARS